MNAVQRDRFAAVAATVKARRYSLANSAGICLGRDYAFDLVRPGLALYGGVPRDEAVGHIAQVAFPEAEVVQRRIVRAGETIGYGATWTAARRHRGGDRQHRLCRRLSALLRRQGLGERRRQAACR